MPSDRLNCEGGTPIAVRRASVGDFESVVRIFNQAIPLHKANGFHEAVSNDGLRPWFRAHFVADRPILVAVHSSVVIGWISLSDVYDGAPAFAGTAEVSVYVDRRYWRMGIGRLLLTEAIFSAAEWHIKTLLATVFDHNTASLQLFASMGFAPWGHLEEIAQFDDVQRGLVLMGLRVSSQLRGPLFGL